MKTIDNQPPVLLDVRYDDIANEMKFVRQSICGARAADYRLRVVRVNGWIEFRVGGETVCAFGGSEGLYIDCYFLNHFSFEFRRKHGVLPVNEN